MARRTQVFLDDDIDGGAATQTLYFASGGLDYEIDLSDANAENLNNAFAPWVKAARRVTTPRPAVRPSARAARNKAKTDVSKVRDWGRANGFTVAERGRIPEDLTNAYQQSLNA
jgi:hypothetical protein